MALWFDLNINATRIANVEIRRTTDTNVDTLADLLDSIHQYTVRVDGHIIGTLQHRYGNGAFRLTCLAADLIARQGTHTMARNSSGQFVATHMDAIL